VTARRLPVFFDFAAGLATARQLVDIEVCGHWTLLAWVIMPDHVHALIAPQLSTFE
jgi:REP element-mobilizing transposase RayT